MLRKPDTSVCPSRQSLRKLGADRGAFRLILGLLAAFAVLAQPEKNLEKQLEAAIHRETIVGDLAGAIQIYQSVLAQSAKDRSTAARALLQIAQCQEKLGQRKDARATYSRVVHEYADQVRPAAMARNKLAGWIDAAPGPRNLAFEEGAPGQMPPGWFTPAMPRGGERSAELRRTGCRSGHGCAVITGSAQRAGILMQSFSAAAYRGKTIRLRASMKMDGGQPDDRGSIWLRVGRGNSHAGNADTLDDRPVRGSSWTTVDVVTEIDADAQFLELGVSSMGQGRLWVDDLSFEIVPKLDIDVAREAVAGLYLGMDAALEQGTFELEGVLVPGAPFRIYGRELPLRDALKPAGYGTYQTTIAGFHLSGTGAVATVRSEFASAASDIVPPGVATYRDSWARTREGWKLRDRVFLTGHYRARRTDAQAAKLVSADLKQLAAPLAIADAGHSFYDLAPFGNAIESARVVALGAATEGTHEIFRLRHRLLEYLVKEKGFRLLALAANGLDGDAIDHYIQTGEGDPRAALGYVGTASQELLDAIEWMRAYNRAAGNKGTLGFAALAYCEQTEAATVVPQGACGDDRLAKNLEATMDVFPDRKILVWGNNFDVAPLRAKFGSRIYVTGFALQHGEVRAAGFMSGSSTGLGRFPVPRFAEGTGDWVLGSAGMPLFFLDQRSVPNLTTLGLWLAEPHLFLMARGEWNRDDPENHLHPVVMARLYDGLIFIADGHAAQDIEAPPATTTH